MIKMRHLISLLFFLCFVNAAGANPIIFAPTGTTLTTGQTRIEGAFSPCNDDGKYYWFGAGLKQYEVNMVRQQTSDGSVENRLGAQWSFIPETFFTPAVSFGIKDLTSQSKEGFGVYAAVTRHLPLSCNQPYLQGFALTFGIGTFGVHSAFCGFEAKLPFNLYVDGEFDSRDTNASIGWQPNKYVRFKSYTIQNKYYFGAELLPIEF